MRIVVIGGGVIGLACAWELNRRDHDVVVLEQATFGSGVSRGNAGWICPSLASPLAAPGMVREGIRQLLHGGGSFRLRPRLDPTLARWLVEFASNCRLGAHATNAQALAELSRGTLGLFDAYLDAGVELELHRDGLVIAARTEDKLAAYRRPGLVELDGRAAAQLEPALDGDAIAGALFSQSDRHVRPETLTRGLAQSLQAGGADMREHAAVRSLARRGREWVVNEELATDAVVVAAGLGSAGLVRMKRPLVGARGYSVGVTGVRPSHALYLAGSRLAMSPFADGVRLAGVLELGAPSRMSAAQLLSGAAPYLVSTPVASGELWSGLRPATPSGVPLIERREPGLVVAAGHAMLGVTLAPATAVRVASLL